VPAWVVNASHPNDGVPDPTGRIVFGRITRVDEIREQIVSLYAIDPDGSDLVQLLDCDVARPRFSPDGSRLAFGIAMDDGSMQIATMAADGGDLRIITATPGYADTPDWSPDGSWLVYSHSPVACVSPSWDVCTQHEGMHPSLWRIDADGSDPAPLGDQDAFDWEPRLSPDGRQVVFTRVDVFDGDWYTLMIRDLASGEERVVTSNEREPEHPDWGPDGRWIIYNTLHPAGSGASMEQLERVPVDDPTAEPEVLHGSPAIKAAYSPDGARIVFGCGGPLCTMGADGSDVDVLVDTAHMDDFYGVPYDELNHFDWGPGQPSAD
jgi:dipeptidyl aminopeptidase/acylaminoacyl peptidase